MKLGLALGLLVIMTLVRPLYAQVTDATESPPPFGGSFTFSGSIAEGTQQSTTLGTAFFYSYSQGVKRDQLQGNTRIRLEGTYNTGKKPGQDRVTSAELYYGELRQAVDARQFLSLFRGSLSARATDETRLWLYGVASAYHHIAFGLDLEQAYGIGLAYDFVSLPGLALAVDLRHIDEEFDGQESFSSWAMRLHMTHSTVRVIGANESSSTTLILSESVEVIPPFESSEALQARAFVDVRIPLARGFQANLTLGGDYMQNAPPATKDTYWKSSLGITYNFGNNR